MSLWTFVFICTGLAIVSTGVFTIFFNTDGDERARQTGFVFFAAGIVLSLGTAFAAHLQHHLN